MAKILSFDLATNCGFGFYNTDKPHSAIECGVFNVGIKLATATMRRTFARRKTDEEVCRLIDHYRPDVACIEQPLNYIKTGGGKPRRKKTPMFGDDPPQDDGGGEDGEGGGGPNAATVLLANQIFAVADTVCQHKVELVVHVDPKTWQVLTKHYHGNTKERSIEMCRALRIVIPGTITRKPARADAADAACIAFWCAGHAQELKLMNAVAAATGDLLTRASA